MLCASEFSMSIYSQKLSDDSSEQYLKYLLTNAVFFYDHKIIIFPFYNLHSTFSFQKSPQILRAN